MNKLDLKFLKIMSIYTSAGMQQEYQVKGTGKECSKKSLSTTRSNIDSNNNDSRYNNNNNSNKNDSRYNNNNNSNKNDSKQQQQQQQL